MLGIILIPIAAILIARRVLLKPEDDLYPAIPQYNPGYAGGASFSATEIEQPTFQIPAAEPQVAPPPLPNRRPSIAHQQVLDLAEKDPSQIAALVRLWMNEEK